MSRTMGRPNDTQEPESATLAWDHDQRVLRAAGRWTAPTLKSLQDHLGTAEWPTSGTWFLDTDAVKRFDTAGAWVLNRITRDVEKAGALIDTRRLPAAHRELMSMVASQGVRPPSHPRPMNPVERLGRLTVNTIRDLGAFLEFVGRVAVDGTPFLLRPHRLRWRSVLHEVQAAGVNAVPIIGLLSFLMGIVIAYQGGETLEQYGANIFIVDLVSITILREMSPLLVAIVVAGRTGSSYTAQIGTMKITEEIDAIRVMGLVPNEVLTLPRLVALFLALPLMTVFADIMGIVGGMVIADLLYDVSFRDFLDRMPLAFYPSTYWVGIGKAPVFAAIITAIGCYQGFSVLGGAEGLGRATTTSVVQALFLVITADALFSVAFNMLGL